MVVVAIFISLIVFGVAYGLAFFEKNKRTGETPNEAGFAYSVLCGGQDKPLTQQSINLDGKTYSIPESGRGLISAEEHLVTTSDPVQKPSNNLPSAGRAKRGNEGIEEHLKITNFSKNCPSSSSYCNPKKQEWTPAEGGGEIGQGTSALGSIPTEIEPWIMNARWHIPKGTKVIITSIKTNKSIVAVGGYEYGPSARTGHIAGAQKEVLANLGISHGSEIIFGFAVDQNLTPGTLFGDCTMDNSNFMNNAVSGECAERIIKIAQAEVGKEYFNNCTPYADGKCLQWCAAFTSWVYKKAGYINGIYPGTKSLKEQTKQLQVNNVNGKIEENLDGEITNILPGDIFWIKATDTDSGFHVGIVEYIDFDGVHTIEGNVGHKGKYDRVARRRHPFNKIIATARPLTCAQ